MSPFIETENLILRAPVLDDAAFMAKHLAEPEIVRMTSTIPPYYFVLSAEFWILRRQANWRRGAAYAYIITKKNGTRVGVIDMFDASLPTPELGYWIGKPYWGQGHLTEAAWGLIAHIFETTDCTAIKAAHFVDNTASARCLQKLGFSITGRTESVFSIARGCKAKGIELRLPRPATIKPAMTSTTDTVATDIGGQDHEVS